MSCTNCQKDNLFANSEDKIIGSWKYDKVTFKKEDSFKSNVTKHKEVNK